MGYDIADSRSVADELASALFALDVGTRTTSAVTRQISETIVRWALANGWTPRVEARVQAVALAEGARLGYVDVVVHRGADAAELAIEINSADKPWSLDKLRHAARAGMHAIWIRWGDDTWAGSYEDVDVIQLWWPARPGRRTAARQTALW